jgi:hypothetical protein
VANHDNHQRFLRDDVFHQFVGGYVDSQTNSNKIFLRTEVVSVTPIKEMLFAVGVCSMYC